MKKTLLVTLGITLILAVLAVWVYLFLNGKPQEGEGIFSNFGSGNGDSPINTPGDPVVDTNPIDTTGGSQKLRQLTTRPVAGATFTGPGIRYMERGTGHIYDITLSDGNESLVSGKTLPQAVEAVFSPSGNSVAYTIETSTNREVAVGGISKGNDGGGSLDVKELPKTSKDISFSETGEELYYLERVSGGSRGHAYHLAKKTDSVLFTLPLRDAEVLWGETPYVYTTPSAAAEGHLYQLESSTLSYVHPGGYGLMGVRWGETVFVTLLSNNKLVTYPISSDGQSGGAAPIVLFEEKCVPVTTEVNVLLCAAPLDMPTGTLPDDWYKGAVSFSDYLWRVHPGIQEAELLSDFFGETGRTIDVKKMGASTDGKYLYFINKNDNTLWMYDLTV